MVKTILHSFLRHGVDILNRVRNDAIIDSLAQATVSDNSYSLCKITTIA